MIELSEEQSNLVDFLITNIELGLKEISNKFKNELDLKLGVEDEKNRHLTGVFRVGHVEKGTLLKSDNELNLIALISTWPSLDQVKQISNELNDYISKNLKDRKLELIDDESIIKNEACIYVKSDQYKVKVSFTSMELEKKVDENCSDDILLPNQKCIDQLEEIKRVKWFNSKLKTIDNALFILRIMRDICQRTPTWSILNDYLLELIIDKCFSKHKYDNLALKFRTVFESISSGLLFMSKSSNFISITSDNINMKSYEYIYLNDPCNPLNDPIESLPLQKREDLTSSAQHALRLLTFNKINQILGIENC
jgi:zinc finger RNA-binding protein